jgi:hypothetical protein
MICPVCKEEIIGLIDRVMISSDRPYFNVYIHRSCLPEIMDGFSQYEFKKIYDVGQKIRKNKNI